MLVCGGVSTLYFRMVAELKAPETLWWQATFGDDDQMQAELDFPCLRLSQVHQLTGEKGHGSLRLTFRCSVQNVGKSIVSRFGAS